MNDIEAYAALDLEPGSSLSVQLMEQVEQEHIQDGVITLTGDESDTPLNLTPRMSQWYIANIAPKRLQALDEVSSLFRDDPFGKSGAPGRLMEAALDQLAQGHSNDRRRTFANFHTDHNADLAKARDSAHREYEIIRAEEGGREPAGMRPALYYGILVGLGIPELVINYDSFLNNGMLKSPALALGLCIVVALGIATASHFQGTLLKQWRYYFGPDDRTRKLQGVQLLSASSGLLTVCLAMIAYFRFGYVTKLLNESILLGTAPPNVGLLVAGLLLGNIVVFSLGAFLAFTAHDQNPEYPKKKAKYLALKEQYEALYRTKVKDELDRLSAKYSGEVSRIKAAEHAQSSSAKYKENRNLFAKVQATDASVIGCLANYRQALVAHLQKNGAQPRFMRPGFDQERGMRDEAMSAKDYLAASLQLKVITSGR